MRRERKGIMLARVFDRDKFEQWPKPVFVQPKLEGERCRALLNQGAGEWEDNVIQLSSTELELIGTPHIARELSRLANAVPIWNTNLIKRELDGELYKHKLTFQQIHSRASRKVNIHPKHKELEYHVFDFPRFEALQSIRVTQMESLYKVILELELKYIKIVPTYTVDDYTGMLFHLKMFREQGYEGIIIRHPENIYERKKSVMIMKLKPTEKDKYKIVGFTEEISKDGIAKGTLGAFVVVDKDNSSFKVGTGRILTKHNRQALWLRKNELMGKILVVNYSHLTDDKHIPYTPVALEIEGELL